ncbi:MAG: diamine acetyltransferase [Planctomycetota bacterium]|nr:diamine acetyltransferase [Planctomycetota bacterium]
MNLQIRHACEGDCETLVGLIHELAVYERLGHEARATAEDLRRHLFGERPYADALIAEDGGFAIGFALFFFNFSTFKGKPGIYLEDLFVKPEFRGRGIGKALLARLARTAVERDCGRFEWAVLDWNEPSIAFYKALGARPMEDWTVYRVDGDALEILAARDRE